MIEEGGSLMTDFESAPHIAKNKVLSLTPLIPGSKVVKSKGCNFHFSSGVMKDSKFFTPIGMDFYNYSLFHRQCFTEVETSV